ncbi:hypothetical protein MUN88_07165 [Gracilibacillus caseinilyticus]|uniref:Uncharacterized protein n=1 Tax=Gracilibacillus caseinilyticus TaxID=2932256 RepID=A0ABY4F0V5_9BACI|nr:hypothetical protein [Gracilibacillus caseinilyticus]UOQ49846.1 hypothetical protein MUN88_07165 [Gracilibacillus caseinilyticus]
MFSVTYEDSYFITGSALVLGDWRCGGVEIMEKEIAARGEGSSINQQ